MQAQRVPHKMAAKMAAGVGNGGGAAAGGKRKKRRSGDLDYTVYIGKMMRLVNDERTAEGKHKKRLRGKTLKALNAILVAFAHGALGIARDVQLRAGRATMGEREIACAMRMLIPLSPQGQDPERNLINYINGSTAKALLAFDKSKLERAKAAAGAAAVPSV